MPRNYEALSYWLESVGGLTPRPRLGASQECDVAIVGAGFSGLWTAYYLLSKQPGLKVAVLESEIAGFGGSGRNGGWCNPTMMGVTPAELTRRYGVSRTKEALLALRARVDEIGEVCDREQIDARFRRSGVLRIARGAHEQPSLDEKYDSLKRLGLHEDVQMLDADQLADRVRVGEARGGLFDPHVAWVQPGRLVRGLAEAVEQRGGVIYEQTPVLEHRPARRPQLVTKTGTVTADTVVLAGEAYLSRMTQLRRRVMPLYSLVILTEPLSDAQWESIGWAGGEGLSSCCLSIDYLSRTDDGRILFGGRGAPYHFRSDIRDEYDRHDETHRRLRRYLREWFPALGDVSITHEWGGPLAIPRDWMPNVGLDRKTNTAYAFGYSGQGLVPSNLAGEVVADLILDRDSHITGLPFIGHRSRNWEVEPLRWTAVRYLQSALLRLDERGQATGRPATGRTVAERLTRH
jgi:glycine/D-amino acid oxidase-like deaminating enzyme